jgi:hypothetical protein
VIAERQDGVVSTAQLRAAGIGAGGIRHRVTAGRLHQLHRGVFALGHRRIGPRGLLFAAVLACGYAVISHRAAAWVHNIIGPPALPIDVTTLRESRSRPGIRVHRSCSLDPQRDVTYVDGLPMTTPARTLLDLAATRVNLDRALREAEVQRVFDLTALNEVLERAPRHPGAARLRRALDGMDDPEPTDSELENILLELLKSAGLPTPVVGATVASRRRDFYWPEHRLVVEMDGARTHLTPTAFEDDRRRDAELAVAGIRTVRFTWRQATRDPDHVIGTLRTLLA